MSRTNEGDPQLLPLSPGIELTQVNNREGQPAESINAEMECFAGVGRLAKLLKLFPIQE